MSKLIRKNSTVAASTPFVTSNPSGGLADNFTGFLGFRFTVGAAPITVTDLGRWVVSGNSQTHTVKITDTLYNTITSVAVNTSGQPVGYLYAAITPVVLAAGESYVILSEEFATADERYPVGTYTSTSDGTIYGWSYFDPVLFFGTTPNEAYGPSNFKYHL